MKKFVTLLLLAVFTSCNDGDFDVPAFEFSETVSSCGEYLLYITNTSKTEVLVLNLSETQIAGIEGEKDYTVSSSLKVTYRIFKEGIGANYFCQSIPPSSPKVLKELIADSGTINILTTLKTAGTTNVYNYEIILKELLFVDGEDRIFFENLSFGTFTK